MIPALHYQLEQSTSVLPQVFAKRLTAIKNVSHLALMVASLINGYDEAKIRLLKTVCINHIVVI
ncbi:MAG: hypothetical protein ACLRQF_02845 [Thomasclavelia ramosa]